MKKFLSTGAALLLTTTVANAGGLDRTGNPYAVMFEDGNYVELSFSSVKPEVSGDYPTEAGGGSTGDMAEDYSSAGLALKFALTEQMDVGVFLNQPFGANANYTGGFYDGLSADWDSKQIAVVLKYQATPNISVYGGVRSVESEAVIAIPGQLIQASAAQALGDAAAAAAAAGDLATAGALAGQAGTVLATPTAAFAYDASTDADRQTSYVLGAAYERPDIALRVALTFETGFTHSFVATETLAAQGLAATQSEFEIEMPKSITLDFQSGVAADTLVFGSVKWSEWSVWEVRPAGYEAFTGDRVTGLDNDVTTLRLGVGRKINDNLSVFGRATYEKANGGVASRLSPSDGSRAFGFGGTYTMDDIKITGGIEFVKVGDATDGTPVEFADNKAVGFGLSVGYSF